MLLNNTYKTLKHWCYNTNCIRFKNISILQLIVFTKKWQHKFTWGQQKVHVWFDVWSDVELFPSYFLIKQSLCILHTNTLLSIYIYIYFLGLSVCLFVTNKHQNGWTNRAQILCGTSYNPKKGLCLLRIQKVVSKFWKFTKKCKSAKILLVITIIYI